MLCVDDEPLAEDVADGSFNVNWGVVEPDAAFWNRGGSAASAAARLPACKADPILPSGLLGSMVDPDGTSVA